MRTMSHPNAKAIILNPEEYEILRKASEILADVQCNFGGANTILSLETGEVIAPGELARAGGILNFIATYRMVEIS